uniref:Uncharacterized protein n=1 Tax=Anguilla anguilla TaxID=7936 RepID=A0A0E9SUV9_ANGAN
MGFELSVNPWLYSNSQYISCLNFITWVKMILLSEIRVNQQITGCALTSYFTLVPFVS